MLKPNKKMNLVQRKKAEQNIKKIKSTNDEFSDFLQTYVQFKDLTDDEKNYFKTLSEHLSNMNFIFDEMLKQV